MCFFFCRTGEPQQRWLYPQRAPSANRLGTVASLNEAMSFCWSLEDEGPSEKARTDHELSLHTHARTHSWGTVEHFDVVEAEKGF